MSVQDEVLHAPPTWSTPPGETDVLAWVAAGLIILALFGLITLYAAFDRWAEHRSSGTPLAKTIPTLLTIALLYEIFPLEHFSILLPLSAILLALVADWSRFHLVAPQGVGPGNEAANPEGSQGVSTTDRGRSENA
jgi:hypothetical protein